MIIFFGPFFFFFFFFFSLYEMSKLGVRPMRGAAFTPANTVVYIQSEMARKFKTK